MWKSIALVAVMVAGAALVPTAGAHHGWGSYDAKSPITVAGKVLTSKYENPHVVITIEAVAKPEATSATATSADAVARVWTITLAPTSRMVNRGALAELVAVGKECRSSAILRRWKKTRCAPSASRLAARRSRCDRIESRSP